MSNVRGPSTCLTYVCSVPLIKRPMGPNTAFQGLYNACIVSWCWIQRTSITFHEKDPVQWFDFRFFVSVLNLFKDHHRHPLPVTEIQCLWILKVMEKMLCWQPAETRGHVFPCTHKSWPPLAPCLPFSYICSTRCLLAILTDWEAWFISTGRDYSRKFN